jgi:hypothetical protein
MGGVGHSALPVDLVALYKRHARGERAARALLPRRRKRRENRMQTCAVVFCMKCEKKGAQIVHHFFQTVFIII